MEIKNNFVELIAGAAMKNISVILTIILAVFMIGCSSSKDSQKEGPKYTKLPSGLQYLDLKVGDGKSPEKGNTLTVHYKGTLEDGTVFDSSYERGDPMTFKYIQTPMIKGFDEGLATMKVGGKRRLIIPARLGYGDRPSGKIPPGSTLIFEIELLKVE